MLSFFNERNPAGHHGRRGDLPQGVELMWSGRGLDGVGGALGLLVDVALEALVSDWMFPETHGRPL